MFNMKIVRNTLLSLTLLASAPFLFADTKAPSVDETTAVVDGEGSGETTESGNTKEVGVTGEGTGGDSAVKTKKDD